MSTWPQDPMILLSVINTRLRDQYASLRELCEDTDTDEEALTAKLAKLGWHYDEERNQFR